jgi:hypothetical protein
LDIQEARERGWVTEDGKIATAPVQVRVFERLGFRLVEIAFTHRNWRVRYGR